MNTQNKEETIKLFAEAFHEVVVPVLEKMNLRMDKIEKDIKEIKKLLKNHDKRLDRHAVQIDRLLHN
ncbi:hypothetical protein BH10PAT1_BH10PAT1_0050 [soil metagenome]